MLRPLSTSRTENAHVDVPSHTVTAGDAAQARRFVHMLQTELVLLQRRLDRVSGDQRMREEVKKLAARIAELQRLLVALRARFGETANATAVRRNHVAPAAPARK